MTINRIMASFDRLCGYLHIVSSVLIFFLSLGLWLMVLRILIWMTAGPFTFYAPILLQGPADRHFDFAAVFISTWLLGWVHILGPLAYGVVWRIRGKRLLDPDVWFLGLWQFFSGVVFIFLIMSINH